MDDADFQAKLERALTWAEIWKPAICTTCQPHWCHGKHFNTSHGIPCPPLTDELAMIVLGKLEAKGFQYQLMWDGKLACLDCWPPETIKRRIDGPWTSFRRDAIVLAVAALAEQEKKH